MTRTCTVCNHKEVDEINRCLLSGTPYRSIAGQFQLSKSALERHKDYHIPLKLLKADDIKDYTAAQELAYRLKDESDLVRELRDEARGNGDINTALRAVDRALKCIELCARVQCLIQEQTINVNTQVNIYDSSEWIAVGSVLARILAPYPEIRVEVSMGLLALQESHK